MARGHWEKAADLNYWRFFCKGPGAVKAGAETKITGLGAQGDNSIAIAETALGISLGD